MPENVRLLDPRRIRRNPENPRLVFRLLELEELRESIAKQGILVPLTVYEDAAHFVLLDGERRWRCALKLGLDRVPAIINPKPDKLTNIMMMFAIHNTRRDWDPLPTALKLADLESEFERRNGRKPKERELAGIASLRVGEVRRLRELLALPQAYREQLLTELEKPREDQKLTVDLVLEVVRGVSALEKSGLVAENEVLPLQGTLIEKFQRGVLSSTVEPRKLAKLARSVGRGELSPTEARNVVERVRDIRTYSINDAFRDSIEAAEYQHSVELSATRLATKLQDLGNQGPVSKALRDALLALRQEIDSILG